MEQNISGRKSERCCLPCAALLKLTRTMTRNPSLPSRQRRFVLHPAVVTKGSRVRKLRNEVKPKTWDFQRTGRSIVGMVVGICQIDMKMCQHFKGSQSKKKRKKSSSTWCGGRVGAHMHICFSFNISLHGNKSFHEKCISPTLAPDNFLTLLPRGSANLIALLLFHVPEQISVKMHINQKICPRWKYA